MSSVSQCCRELRFIETKPKILNKKGFVLSVTKSGKRSGLREKTCPISATTPTREGGRAVEGGERKTSESLPSRH